MLDTLQSQLQLPATTLGLMAVAVLIAGMVRGFSGFGLSALVMAAMSVQIPPIQLIPVCFVLEATSSIIMFRGGVANGNARMVLGLVTGYIIGLPLGLAATHALAPEASRLIALLLILTLASLQMFKVSPAFLRLSWGVYVAGFLAGTATGLASLGGMVVALYVLALQVNAREIRGSLVLFLMSSMLVTGSWLFLTNTMTSLAFMRGALFAPIVILGVLLGSWLFRPSLEPFYKRFCLMLLMTLAIVGLGRMALI